jgi:hypothetical protein
LFYDQTCRSTNGSTAYHQVSNYGQGIGSTKTRVPIVDDLSQSD